MFRRFRRRGRRTWPQRFLLFVNLGLVVAFLGTAFGLGYAYTKFGRLPRVEIGGVLSADESEVDGSVSDAQNFLIVGVDTAGSLDPNDPVLSGRANIGGSRSDTMIILRVDPAGGRAAILSIPRDLWVPIAGTRGSQKINAATAIGGPERLIRTIQDYFGIPIQHYLQIDFAGFYGLVDALDGVPIYFPHPVRDRKSGLSIPEAGCIVLDAPQALGFVRSRAYQEQIDGRWRTDGTGDLGRVKRQQLFIQVALSRAIDKGLRNPVSVDRLIDAALNAVATDETLTGDEVLTLAGAFRSFDPSSLDVYTIPVYGDFEGGAEVLKMQERSAEQTLDIFRGLDPSLIDEGSVRVMVLNGTGNPGEATETRTLLRAEGFTVRGTGDAEDFGFARTEIRYPAGAVAEAELLNRWLAEPARMVETDEVSSVTLITGLDFDGLLAQPRPSSTETTATTLPRRTTTTTDPDRPTTTVLGTVPLEAPDDAISAAACQ